MSDLQEPVVLVSSIVDFGVVDLVSSHLNEKGVNRIKL